MDDVLEIIVIHKSSRKAILEDDIT
jgi:hypothetical protein